MSDAAAIALNEAFGHHMAGRLSEAEVAYREAILLGTVNPDAFNNLGVVLESSGRPEEAAASYRLATAINPGSVSLFVNLGNALRASGQLEEAVKACERALLLEPDYVPAHNNLGAALYGLGRLDAACEAYRQALAYDPTLIQTRLNLAQALYEGRRAAEAAVEYQAVADRDPANRIAPLALALLYMESEMYPEAKRSFERAIELDPKPAYARLNYANCLEALGDHAGAARERKAALAIQRVFVEPFVGAAKRADIALLSVAGFGNLPTDFLVDRREYGKITIYPEDPPRAGVGTAPPFDLVFNVIADPDAAGHALDGAEVFLAKAGKPFLNDPARVRRTRRDLAPELLAGLSKVVVPRTIAARRKELLVGGDDILAAIGPFPLLARPAGSHGGENLELVEDRAALTRYLESWRDEDVYLTRFHDFRGGDGLFRKYRIIFVDRKIYPLHLCIDHKWKVHYYTSMMRDHAWMRAEEEAFLADIGAAFPPELQQAATAIAERLDLDYAGMDCSITRDGELLVFEANANMLAHLNDSIEMFPYKHRYVPRVRDAFHALVRKKLGRG